MKKTIKNIIHNTLLSMLGPFIEHKPFLEDLMLQKWVIYGPSENERFILSDNPILISGDCLMVAISTNHLLLMHKELSLDIKAVLPTEVDKAISKDLEPVLSENIKKLYDLFKETLDALYEGYVEDYNRMACENSIAYVYSSRELSNEFVSKYLLD